MHTQRTRRIGGRGDDASACVITQPGETPSLALQLNGLMATPTTDDHCLPLQFRIAQQLDGRVKRVHIKMGDETASRHGDE